MECKSCHNPKEPGDLLGGMCVECIYSAASKMSSVTREDIERVKREVEAETAGLFPPEMLLGLLDDLIDAVGGGEDRDLALLRASSDIQRLGGLG